MVHRVGDREGYMTENQPDSAADQASTDGTGTDHTGVMSFTVASVGPGGHVLQVQEVNGDLYAGPLSIHHHDGTRSMVRTPDGAVDVECPYPGLAAFGMEQAKWFYGRDQLAAQVIETADKTLGTGGLLTVVAPSGAGKSSLLRAGVLPRIAAGGLPALGSMRWPQVWLTPTARPVRALATGLAAVLDVDDRKADDPGQLVEHLRTSRHRVVVIVDQLEELFTLCRDDAERRTFVDLVDRLAAPGGGLVVCGLRSDFYTPCAAFDVLREALQHNQIFVGAMSTDELRQAILFPARDVGLTVEPALVDFLLRDLTPGGPNGAPVDWLGSQAGYEPGRLPLLAHALRATWQHRDRRTMTVEAYHETGGIQKAIANTADRVYRDLEPAARAAAQQVFLRLVRIGDTDDGIDDARRRTSSADLAQTTTTPHSAGDVVAAFTDARLLTAERDTVEITHEALLRAWPLLRQWIDADRAGLRTRQNLIDAAESWDRAGEDPSDLYNGTRLATADEWATTAGSRANLPTLARRFLDESIQRQRDTEQATRRRVRNLRRLVAGLVVLVLLATTAGVGALIALNTATRLRNLALSRTAAGSAQQLRLSNPPLAAQLSLAAYRLDPTPDALSSLLDTFASPYAIPLTDHTNNVESVVFNSTGTLLATGSDDRTTSLWDTAVAHRPRRLATLTGQQGGVRSVAFSDDAASSPLLAAGSDDHTTELWSVRDPAHPALLSTLRGDTDAVTGVAFSPARPGGRFLATGDMDGVVRLWNISDPAHARLIASLPRSVAVYAVAFSPDGRTLAAANGDGTVSLWNMANPDDPVSRPTLTGHVGAVFAVAFSPAGNLLASTGDDRTVRLWNVADSDKPHLVSAVNDGGGDITAAGFVAFSPDGTTLVAGSHNIDATMWDITVPAQPRLTAVLPGHENTVSSAAFSPAGGTLVTGSFDHTVRLWDVPLAAVIAHNFGIDSMVLSSNGQILATGSFDHTVRLWDVSTPGRLDLLSTITLPNNTVVALSPDGRTLAVASFVGTVELWNVSNPKAPAFITDLTGAPTESVVWLAYTPDGRTLATASWDGTTRLWDVTSQSRPALIATLNDPGSKMLTVAISHDGTLMATGGTDDTVRLWDIRNRRHPALLSTLTSPTGYVQALAFSPTADILAATGQDGVLRVWDATDPSQPTSMGTQPLPKGFAVAFSDDGQTVAAGTNDGSIRIWNIHHLDDINSETTLNGTGWISGLAFERDGHTLISGSGDNTVITWDTDPNRVAARICASVYLTITPAQWAQYFTSAAYQPPC